MNPNDPTSPGLVRQPNPSLDECGGHARAAGEGDALIGTPVPQSTASHQRDTGPHDAQDAAPAGLEAAGVEADTVAASVGPASAPAAQTELASVPAPEPALVGQLATPARTGTSGDKTWNPEEVPAVSAAKAAADFVATIFADAPPTEPEVADAQNAAGDTGETGAAEAPSTDAPAPSVHSLLGLQDQHMLVLGLGASGLAMARWCVRWGARVTVADTRAAPPQLAVLRQELPQVRFVTGPLDARLVDDQALHAVLCSPGLSPAAIAPVVIAAGAGGISARGELDLYSAGLAALQASQGYQPSVLGVTGTNGKTTVTALTGQLVERCGKRVAVAGNIGPTLLDTLAAAIDTGDLPDVWVLELSSFQLDGATGFEPTAAAVLNVTQDHLDWHGDFAAYAAAKARVFGQIGVMLLNREDATVMQMLPPPGRPKPAAPSDASDTPAAVPLRARFQKPQQRAYISFGGDMPQRPGDFGIEMVSGMPWLVRALQSDETRKGARHVAEELYIQRLMPADALRIRGRHNAVNALAALALASSAGCALAPMLYGLREYRGEPHRVEPVGTVQGVEYFDDSKGTNVGATVAALTGLGAERRLVVILGGDGKGQDFSPLAVPVSRYARAVVLIGRDAPRIRAVLQDAGVPLLDADTLPDAVALATCRAHPGDAVLMSPACASFDMFNDYEHRARVFCDAVGALADDAGQSVEGTS